MASKKFKIWWKKFCKTGSIEPVQLGLTRDQLLEILGPPDDYSIINKGQEPQIFKYHDLEFHFVAGEEGHLYMIFMDDNDGLTQICIQQLKCEQAH